MRPLFSSRRLWLGSAILAPVLLAAAVLHPTGAGATGGSCVGVPARVSALAGASHTTITAGKAVLVELIEPDRYTGLSSSFPWRPPSSSDSDVLERVPICRREDEITTLPERLYGRPRPFEATVTVRS